MTNLALHGGEGVRVIFGDSRSMKEVKDNSVGLVLTSPPYYNAPFDFPDLFPSYANYLSLLNGVGKEIFRVLEEGRVAVFVTADVRIHGELYPCLLYTSPSPRDGLLSRMPSSA